MTCDHRGKQECGDLAYAMRCDLPATRVCSDGHTLTPPAFCDRHAAAHARATGHLSALVCPRCGGAGHIDREHRDSCASCGGTGRS